MNNLRTRRTDSGEWILLYAVDTGAYWDTTVIARWSPTLRVWVPFTASLVMIEMIGEINSRAHDPYKLCYNCMGLGVVDARNKTQSGAWYREVICPTCQGQCVKLPFSQQAELEL